MDIRYYHYKINLYVLGNYYLDVFINHKQSRIEKIGGRSSYKNEILLRSN